MICIDNATFGYGGDFELSVPQLRVPSGRAVAVVGPSGSGKTTLLNLAAGILVPQAGKVEALGSVVSSLSDSARRDFRIQQMGLIFQEFELLDYLSVIDNILLPSRLTTKITLSKDHRQRAKALAEEIGIADKLHRYVRRLSQGERQRVAVCRALLFRPPILLCDEPTGNLDPTNKQHVLDVLFRYVRDAQATLLAVTHDHGMLDRFDETIDVGQFQTEKGQRK